MTYTTDTAGDLTAALDALSIRHHERAGLDLGAEYYAVDFAGYVVNEEEGIAPALGALRHRARIACYIKPSSGRAEQVADAIIGALCEASRHSSIDLTDLPVLEDYASDAADGTDGALVPIVIITEQA